MIAVWIILGLFLATHIFAWVYTMYTTGLFRRRYIIFILVYLIVPGLLYVTLAIGMHKEYERYRDYARSVKYGKD